MEVIQYNDDKPIGLLYFEILEGC
jgi:hypothetical protein